MDDKFLRARFESMVVSSQNTSAFVEAVHEEHKKLVASGDHGIQAGTDEDFFFESPDDFDGVEETEHENKAQNPFD